MFARAAQRVYTSLFGAADDVRDARRNQGGDHPTAPLAAGPPKRRRLPPAKHEGDNRSPLQLLSEHLAGEEHKYNLSASGPIKEQALDGVKAVEAFRDDGKIVLCDSNLTGVHSLRYLTDGRGKPWDVFVSADAVRKIPAMSVTFATAAEAVDFYYRTPAGAASRRVGRSLSGGLKESSLERPREWEEQFEKLSEEEAEQVAKEKNVSLMRSGTSFLNVRYKLETKTWSVVTSGDFILMSQFATAAAAALAYAFSKEGRIRAAQLAYQRELEAKGINVSVKQAKPSLLLPSEIESYFPDLVWLVAHLFTARLRSIVANDWHLVDPEEADALTAAWIGVRFAGWSAQGDTEQHDAGTQAVVNNLYQLAILIPADKRDSFLEGLGISFATIEWAYEHRTLLHAAYKYVLDILPAILGPDHCDDRGGAALTPKVGTFLRASFLMRSGIRFVHGSYADHCDTLNMDTRATFGDPIGQAMEDVIESRRGTGEEVCFISILSHASILFTGRPTILHVRDLSVVHGLSVCRFSELLAAAIAERSEAGFAFKPVNAAGEVNVHAVQETLYKMLCKVCHGATSAERTSALSTSDTTAASAGGGSSSAADAGNEHDVAAVMRLEFTLLSDIFDAYGVDRSGNVPEIDELGGVVSPIKYPRGAWIVESFASRQVGADAKPLVVRPASPEEEEAFLAMEEGERPIFALPLVNSLVSAPFGGFNFSRVVPTPLLSNKEAQSELSSMVGLERMMAEPDAEGRIGGVASIAHEAADLALLTVRAGPESMNKVFEHARRRGGKASGAEYDPALAPSPPRQPEWERRAPSVPLVAPQPQLDVHTARPALEQYPPVDRLRVQVLASRASLTRYENQCTAAGSLKGLRNDSRTPGEQALRLCAAGPAWRHQLRKWQVGMVAAEGEAERGQGSKRGRGE